MQQPSEAREVLDVFTFCQRYGMSAPTFYKEVRAGRLHAQKLGRRTFVTRAEAERWVGSLPKLKLSVSA
jgi:predicted DNA-binding transcriptional regulator AlpA